MHKVSRRTILQFSVTALLAAACKPVRQTPSQTVVSPTADASPTMRPALTTTAAAPPTATVTQTPTDMPTPPPSPVIALSAGSRHSLALREDGTVWAWGTSFHGAIDNGLDAGNGDGSTTPIWIPALSNISAVFAGGDRSMALTADGELWAWGYNDYGALGNGTTEDETSPIRIDLDNVIQVDTRSLRSLAVTNDGRVWTWGYNPLAQILENEPEEWLQPTQIEGLSNIQAVAKGSAHNLALASDGSVFAWGLGECGGCIGNGTDEPSEVPIRLQGLENIIAVSAGASHSLALRSDGTIWEWGSFIGPSPKLVSNLGGVAAIGSGSFHRMALLRDGTVWTWGENYAGQLGHGTTDRDYHFLPKQVPGLSDVMQITSGGGDHSFALQSNGMIWAWGENSFGQLGDGTTELQASPVRVTPVG
jgi:alpha-tubulin suppressor-like RCC1 family protein